MPERKIWRLKEEFVEPIRYSEMLCQALVYVLKKLCLLLEQGQLGVTAIQFILTRLDHVKISLSIGTAAPTHNLAHLEKLLKLKLERIDLGLGIEVIELEATRVASVVAHQLGMTGHDEMATQNLLDWRDLISNRLGSKSLFYMVPRESHIPERAVAKTEVFKTGQFTNASRPIRFLHPPEPIWVTAMLPDSQPAQIRWRGRVIKIIKADGPERIEPEWWSNPMGTSRDYYRVENQEGLRLWVFRQGSPAQWYVQGMFA